MTPLSDALTAAQKRALGVGRFRRLLRAAEACEEAWDELGKAESPDGEED